MPRPPFLIPLPKCEVMAYYVMCSHLRWGDTVVDVGAHVGQNTILSGALVGPQGQVIALEPVDALRHELEDNVYQQGLSNVTALPYAACGPDRLQDKESQYLYVSRDATKLTMNRFWINSEEQEHYQRIPIPCKTVDQICAHLPEIHLLKIDVEGCDVEVLKGAFQTIHRSQNLGVLIELWPYGLEKNNTSIGEMLRILEDHRMCIYILDEMNKQPKRIDADTKFSLPRPIPGKPESITNSQVQNLWCSKQVWDICYDRKSNSPNTVGHIEILWEGAR